MNKKFKKQIKKIITDSIGNGVGAPTRKRGRVTDSRIESKYCEYNKVVSEKFYKFLDLSLRLPFNVTFSENKVNLFLNLDCYKKSDINTFKMNPADDFLDISLTLEGFILNRNHVDSVGYYDDKVYNNYIGKINDFSKKQSLEMFNFIINDVMSLTPIGREFKINSILED
jgi:hypothetical protein